VFSDKTYIALVLSLILAMFGAFYMAYSQPSEEEQKLVSVFNQGVLLKETGDIRGAVEKFAEAEKLAPGSSLMEARVKFNMATILMELLREFDASDAEHAKLMIDIKNLLDTESLDEELNTVTYDLDNEVIETINLVEFLTRARSLLVDALRISPQDKDIAKQLEIVNAWLGPFMEGRGEGEDDDQEAKPAEDEGEEDLIPDEPPEEKEYEKPIRRGVI
jgi:hypothetical protein